MCNGIQNNVFNIHVMSKLEGEKKESRAETVLKEIMDKTSQIWQETQTYELNNPSKL